MTKAIDAKITMFKTAIATANVGAVRAGDCVGITYRDIIDGSICEMEPGHLYTKLDEAVHAACCLCTLHPAGATVYFRVTPQNNEEYMITTEAVDYDGNGWRLDGDGWEQCYTITSPRACK